MKKLIVLPLALMAVNASASNENLTDVRDALKTAYNALEAGAWGSTNHGDAADGLEGLVQYATRQRESVEIRIGSNGEIEAFVVTPTFSQTDWDNNVTALSDGILTDLYGTTDFSSVFSVDTDTLNITHTIDSGALGYTKLNTAVNTLNNSFNSEGTPNVSNMVTAFNNNIAAINTVVDAFHTTDYDDNPDTETSIATLLGNVNGQSTAYVYGLLTYTNGSGDDIFVDGNGTAYCSYEDYANDTDGTSDWDIDDNDIDCS